ncbi:hypothetical protein N825_11080 [Skermanella stibiiresistens SB22]|uniref:Uncharacterized protein n=1 Tax=Skermanella stibiiresistens SB22 TaxID=1385369 RepID=W9H1V9_9PROT|nr:hypothetical protein N825_11080 [Skermanella stibiiresistens SB22]
MIRESVIGIFRIRQTYQRISHRPPWLDWKLISKAQFGGGDIDDRNPNAMTFPVLTSSFLLIKRPLGMCWHRKFIINIKIVPKSNNEQAAATLRHSKISSIEHIFSHRVSEDRS